MPIDYLKNIFQMGDIEETLLAETPVPRNLDKVKQVDDFIIRYFVEQTHA